MALRGRRSPRSRRRSSPRSRRRSSPRPRPSPGQRYRAASTDEFVHFIGDQSRLHYLRSLLQKHPHIITMNDNVEIMKSILNRIYPGFQGRIFPVRSMLESSEVEQQAKTKLLMISEIMFHYHNSHGLFNITPLFVDDAFSSELISQLMEEEPWAFWIANLEYVRAGEEHETVRNETGITESILPLKHVENKLLFMDFDNTITRNRTKETESRYRKFLKSFKADQ